MTTVELKNCLKKAVGFADLGARGAEEFQGIDLDSDNPRFELLTQAEVARLLVVLYEYTRKHEDEEYEADAYGQDY